MTYSLVHYINQITGLWFSKNYHPIPVFIDRAYKSLNGLREDLVSSQYREVAENYLKQMSYFIINFHCFEDDEEAVKNLIPEQLQKSSMQSPPPIEFLPGEF